VQPPWKPFKDPARIWLNADCRPIGNVAGQMAGTYFARQAAEFIEREHKKPYFLMVSFYEPHSPFQFPLEYRGKYDPQAFEVPAVGPEDAEQIPAVFRDLSDAEKRGIAAAYYTSVEFMDHNVGLVLDALERSGEAERTIVVYLGDHGYLLGQHGRFEKHCSYEEAIRVPGDSLSAADCRRTADARDGGAGGPGADDLPPVRLPHHGSIAGAELYRCDRRPQFKASRLRGDRVRPER
jgi:choline-sulfatase